MSSWFALFENVNRTPCLIFLQMLSKNVDIPIVYNSKILTHEAPFHIMVTFVAVADYDI